MSTSSQDVPSRVRIHLDRPEAPAAPSPRDQNGRAAQLARPVVFDIRDMAVMYGQKKALAWTTLKIHRNLVTAVIGPSGCGKSTFIRSLNRMNDSIAGFKVGGQILYHGHDVYGPGVNAVEVRRRIGMVFQKPNPFPAMSIAENVTAGLKLTGTRVDRAHKAALIEHSLRRASLWDEVKDRLHEPGSALSGGQQQRLCIARSLAVDPEILLMDEPCSALDPTSTRRVEETIAEISAEVTVVIVTHNMQQAQRVSHQCAFFLAEQGTPGRIVEAGPTRQVFENPRDPRTADYVNGRFG
jgi:phosphate transport system ATP-binding protein